MQFSTQVPEIRVRAVNDLKVRPDGGYVVYWMTAFRRTRSNFALQYARDLAKDLERPLVILEALRIGYRWASDRFHRFIIEGMRDNQKACESADVLYYPYVESESGAGSGLIEELSSEACVVVSDDYPCFFHPHMIRLVGRRLSVSFRVVDSNCLMPLAAPQREFTVAHSYRRHMQKELPQYLECMPDENPLDGRSTRSLPILKKLNNQFTVRWPAANIESLLADGGLKSLPIDHSVGPGAIEGGPINAAGLLQRFLSRRLDTYNEDRNEPDEYGSSELSPHMHFGHISPHEVFSCLMDKAGWHPGKLQKPNGSMNGFWGVGENVEAFLDQLCTWREIGFNKCWLDRHYDKYESLPDWAQESLKKHRSDKREYVYTLEQFENAETHDKIWNAAQRQLVREGRIHNYMRMVWGKKILHWTQTPQEALRVMIELNNKYALDGRDPNSYSGIFWVLGRFDRAWGPEREVFGKVRYMTTENTAKKHRLTEYLMRYDSLGGK